MSDQLFDGATIRKSLNVLFPDDDSIVELRILKPNGGALVGYYDDDERKPLFSTVAARKVFTSP